MEPAGASCPPGRTEAVTAAAEMLWQRRCWPGVFSGRKRGWFCQAAPEMGSQSVPCRQWCVGLQFSPLGSFLIRFSFKSLLCLKTSPSGDSRQPPLLLCAVLSPSVRTGAQGTSGHIAVSSLTVPQDIASGLETLPLLSPTSPNWKSHWASLGKAGLK